MWVGLKRRRVWDVNPETERVRKDNLVAEKTGNDATRDGHDKSAKQDSRTPTDRGRDRRD